MKLSLFLKKLTTIFCLLLIVSKSFSEENIEIINEPIKLKYAMPLYLDLPGEMDAEKGYKELNIGIGYNSYKKHNEVRTLVEFAFSPVKRLGFEIELPFTFSKAKRKAEEEGFEAPENRLDGLRIGGMYTFKVLDKSKMAFSAGFFNEFEFTPFKDFGHPLFEGNIFNPFVAAAIVYGKTNRFHSIIFTGPSFHSLFHERHTDYSWKINTTFNYRFGKKEYYVGLEIDQNIPFQDRYEIYFRPQVHLNFTNQFALGLVANIPVRVIDMNAGGFIRLIYMPKNRKKIKKS